MQTAEITFFDRSVTYEQFVNDIAAKLATILKEDRGDSESISQREAYRIYGKGNVMRWLEKGAVAPIRRPGKIEYPVARLKELSRTEEFAIRKQKRKGTEDLLHVR